MKPVIGIQLYTLRDFIQNEKDFDETLARLEKMGVRDVQISGMGDIPAGKQAEILKKHGMSVCVTHKDFGRMQNDLDAMIEEHRIIGCDAMGIGSAPGDSRGNEGNVMAFIEKAEAVGKKLAEKWWDNADQVMSAKDGKGTPLIARRQGLVDRSKTIFALVNPDDYEMVQQ